MTGKNKEEVVDIIKRVIALNSTSYGELTQSPIVIAERIYDEIYVNDSSS